MKLENDIPRVGGTKNMKTMEYGRVHYEALIASGMAWEFHPWLTGNWDDDKERFINEVMSKFKNVYTENQNREV